MNTSTFIRIVILLSFLGLGVLSCSSSNRSLIPISITNTIYAQRYDPQKSRVLMSAIDTRTDTVTQEFEIDRKFGLRITDHFGRVFLSFYKEFLGDMGDRIAVFSPEAGKITDTKYLPEGPGHMQALLSGKVSKIYVLVSFGADPSEQDRSYIAVLDGTSLRTISKILADPSPWRLDRSICTNWMQTRLYALEEYMGGGPKTFTTRLLVIDTLSDSIVRNVELDARFLSYQWPISTRDGYLYIPAAGKDDKPHSGSAITIYNERTLQLRKVIKLPGIPSRTAYMPDSHKLYIRVFGSFSGIVIIDTKKGKIVSQIEVSGDTRKNKTKYGYSGIVNSIYPVSPTKIYVTGAWGKSRKPGIQVLDIVTDRFVRFIPGEYGNIAIPPVSRLVVDQSDDN